MKYKKTGRFEKRILEILSFEAPLSTPRIHRLLYSEQNDSTYKSTVRSLNLLKDKELISSFKAIRDDVTGKKYCENNEYNGGKTYEVRWILRV